MKKLKIAGGVALVSDRDYKSVKDIAWYVNKDGYAYHRLGTPKGEPQKHEPMHRMIMNAPKGMDVDHRDACVLNNQRYNLRIVTHAQNEQYRTKVNSNNTSGLRGVSWDSNRQLWGTRLMCNGKQVWLGRFKTKVAARKAWLRAAKKFYGRFVGVSK